MIKNIIQIKGVKKAYKDVEVLKGVDLEVEQGGDLCITRFQWSRKNNDNSNYGYFN